MNDSTTNPQKGTEDDDSPPTNNETKQCPECGDDILFITRRGPSTATAQPCGHSLGGMRVRDLATESQRVATDGGELECEAPGVDEHRGSIKIVLDDEDNVLALCADCRSDFAYTRIIDEDPAGAARADGGANLAQWLDLTGFQQECLKSIARHEAENEVPHGLGIKADLERRYGKEVHHGRLYPNLDDLVNKSLVEKGELDKRTNSYELSEHGRSLLQLALAEDKGLLESMTDQATGRPAGAAVQGGDD